MEAVADFIPTRSEGCVTMPASVDPRLGALKANPLRIRGLRGETRSKPLAEQEESARYGRALERAIEDAGLTKQEAAFRLGYSEQSMISRWIAGQENPPMPRLFVKLGERFKQAWVLELAKQTDGVNVETVMRIAEAKLA
jgi:hypothetical protein